jgi:hypothetical protein
MCNNENEEEYAVIQNVENGEGRTLFKAVKGLSIITK